MNSFFRSSRRRCPNIRNDVRFISISGSETPYTLDKPLSLRKVFRTEGFLWPDVRILNAVWVHQKILSITIVPTVFSVVLLSSNLSFTADRKIGKLLCELREVARDSCARFFCLFVVFYCMTHSRLETYVPSFLTDLRKGWPSDLCFGKKRKRPLREGDSTGQLQLVTKLSPPTHREFVNWRGLFT